MHSIYLTEVPAAKAKSLRAILDARNILGYEGTSLEYCSELYAEPGYLGSSIELLIAEAAQAKLTAAGIKSLIKEEDFDPDEAPPPQELEPDMLPATKAALVMLAICDSPYNAYAACNSMHNVTGEPIFDEMAAMLLEVFPKV